MHVSDTTWSETERMIAKKAFEQAYAREIKNLVETVQQRASKITELNDVWHLHDFLSAKRYDVDGKYDYRDSHLMFVCGRLIKEGWLHLDELEGLDKSKLAKISALTRM